MTFKMFVPDQDPDYEAVATPERNQLAVFQKGAQEAAVKKIDSILECQFLKEVRLKEAELDSIDQCVLEGKAMLDHLRACTVAKYYATVYQIIESDSSTDNASIHPAVKEYVGKCVPTLQASLTNNYEELESQLPNIVCESERQLKEATVSQNSTHENVCSLPWLKSKFKIVVGNVSKFLLPDSRFETNDQATHKWMLYVRGDLDNPDISYLVKKVVFFLHPSYRPNDLVTITNPPFHLARRGWGEFPVRVQIHFCDARNKPLDVIHNLKLDKTFTGLQTLGAETIAHVTLLMTPDQLVMLNKSSEMHKNLKNTDGAKTRNNAGFRESSAVVNNVCPNEKNLICISHSVSNLNPTAKRSLAELPVKVGNLVNNSFIKGSNNCMKNNTMLKVKSDVIALPNNMSANGSRLNNAHTVSFKNSLSSTATVEKFPKEKIFQLLLEDGKLLNVKIQPGLFLNSLNSAVSNLNTKKKDDKQVPVCSRKSAIEIKKSDPDVKIECYNTIHEALFQLVKKYPLGKPKLSRKEFLSLPFGKQRAVEWQRSKTMQRAFLKLLKAKAHPVLSAKDVWTTKKIMLWCRKRGFTPINDKFFSKLFDVTTAESFGTCTLTYAQELLNELENLADFNEVKNAEDEDVLIDVECPDLLDKNVIVKCETNKAIASLLPKENVGLECNSPFVQFVQSVSSEVGLRCIPEELEPGIVAPVVECSIAAACKEFLYRLVHTAMSCRTSSGNVNSLSKEDVCRSILALPEAEFLTNKSLGVLANKL